MTEIKEDMLRVKRMMTDVELVLGKREGEDKLVNKLIRAENLLTYCMSRLDHAIVLPCNIGDTVYAIKVHCFDNAYARECGHTTCDNCQYGIIEIIEVPFDLTMLDKIGKTVFLTPEEAKQVCNGRGYK